MRCSCQQCGTLMVHQEKNSFTGCICPSCQATCDWCIGRGNMITRRKDGTLSIPDEIYDRIDPQGKK